jgi:hypothetical protein
MTNWSLWPIGRKGKSVDGNRFDTLTRRLGGTLSRRRAIAGAIGLATTSAGLGATDSAARTCAGPGRNCTRDGDCCSRVCRRAGTPNNQNRLTCGCERAGDTLCDRSCVDLSTDPRNCGACKNRCGTGATCANGRCLSGPTGPTGRCGLTGPCATVLLE